MAEEKLEEVGDFLINIQLEAEAIKDGFHVEYNGEEYGFTAKMTDRNDKKMTGLMTGVMHGCLGCEFPPVQWNDINRIRQGPQGFPIVR